MLDTSVLGAARKLSPCYVDPVCDERVSVEERMRYFELCKDAAERTWLMVSVAMHVEAERQLRGWSEEFIEEALVEQGNDDAGVRMTKAEREARARAAVRDPRTGLPRKFCVDVIYYVDGERREAQVPMAVSDTPMVFALRCSHRLACNLLDHVLETAASVCCDADLPLAEHYGVSPGSTLTFYEVCADAELRDVD